MNRNSTPAISFLLLLLCSNAFISPAQDTVRMTAQNIYSKLQRQGTHRYLVYTKNGKDASPSKIQFRTRTIEWKNHQGLSVLLIKDQWGYNDSVVHTASSICEAATMKPIMHELWWSGTPVVKVDFQTRQVMVNHAPKGTVDTTERGQAIWNVFKTFANNYVLHSHINLEFFPPLSLTMGLTVIMPFYDPLTGASLEEEVYTVTGEDQLSGYDEQQIDCWLITKTGDGNSELYWISKKTNEVLMSVQQLNETDRRYTIKMGFGL